MPVFAYQGQTRQGRVTYRELTAHDGHDAVRLLRQQQVRVVRMREKSSVTKSWPTWERRIRPHDLMVVTLQLSTLVKAGISLAQGLDMLAAHAEHLRMRTVLKGVSQGVKSGSSFADALKSYPRVFSSWYVGMVEAGEVSGRVDVILERIVQHQEKVLKITQQIRSALIYPMTVLSVALLVISVLLVWVIPMFEPMFSDFGEALPWPTVIVLDTSQFLQEQVGFMVLGALVLGLAAKVSSHTVVGCRVREWVMLKLPVIGGLLKKTALVHVTRTLGVLLRSGVPILEGLAIAGKTSNLSIFQQALHEARIAVRDGQPLAVPLANHTLFPRLVAQMVAVGESTGALDTTLEKVAELYEHEVDRGVLALSTMIEPAIILLLGVGIGFIVVAMYLPIFSMASVVG